MKHIITGCNIEFLTKCMNVSISWVENGYLLLNIILTLLQNWCRQRVNSWNFLQPPTWESVKPCSLFNMQPSHVSPLQSFQNYAVGGVTFECLTTSPDVSDLGPMLQVPAVWDLVLPAYIARIFPQQLHLILGVPRVPQRISQKLARPRFRFHSLNAKKMTH